MAGLKKARRAAAKAETATKAEATKRAHQIPMPPWYKPPVETPAAPESVDPLVMTTGDMDTP